MMWIDIFFRLLFKVILFVTCLFIVVTVVFLSFDFCVKFGDWINKSVIPFFKELKDMVHLIKQLEWDVVYKETKKEIKKWWHDYSVEIITIGVGAPIILALTIILYHYVIHWVYLPK